MSCGLGAVILLFLLIKKNTEIEVSYTEKKIESIETAQLSTLLSEIEKKNNELISTKNNLIKKENDLLNRLSDYQDINAAEKEKKTNINKKISELEKKIVKIDTNSNKNISLEGKGLQEYLIGLEIKGKNILILLDSSASMTDEKLIDIIKRKNLSDDSKLLGPKWQRTLRVVKWLLVRLPEYSKVSIIKFSEEGSHIGNKKWYNNNPRELKELFELIKNIIPESSTNLYAALEKIQNMKYKPDEIFLITDGLPTKGNKDLLKQGLFSRCNYILSNSKKISGDCREKLFSASLKKAESLIKDIRINVILLPLEGDPQAANNYWKLTSKNKGLLLIPSKDWP